MRRVLVIASLAIAFTTAGAQSPPPDPSFRSEEGYGSTRWGMTFSEVMSLYPKGESGSNQSGIVVNEQEVAGKKANLIFVFAEGRLALAGVVFTEEFVNKRRYVYEYRELKKLLTDKYGTPTKDEMLWHQSLYRSNPEEWGMALAAGHLTMFSTWQTPRTGIELAARGERFKVRLQVRYTSVEFSEPLRKQQQADKLKGL